MATRRWLMAGLTVSAVVLGGCGGGDGRAVDSGSGASDNSENGTPSPGTTTPPLEQAACRPAGSFTYSGSASQVAASNGQLAVVVVPSLPAEFQKNRNFTAQNAPASSQVQQASGAFTTLASSAGASDCLGLDHGAVTEIQSVGTDVAIGRWNRAMDTDGNTYNSEQGVHYAVGTPLSLSATSGTLVCTQLMADAVSNPNGGRGGTLVSSSAALDLAARTLNNLSLSINMADTSYTLTNAQAPLNGVSAGGQLSVQSVVVGRDATQPLVAVGYSATLADMSKFAGVVVLACR